MTGTPSEVVLQKVTAFRRWLAYRSFARAASVTVPVLALLQAGYRIWWQSMPLDWSWLAIAGAAGVMIAALVAVWRMPTMTSTAHAIDRRLRLLDRTEAAVTLCGQDDVVSRLIVADAAAHLERHQPGPTFPLDIRWRAGVGGLLVTVLVAAAAFENPSRNNGRATTSGRFITSTEAGQPSATDAARAENDEKPGATQAMASNQLGNTLLPNPPAPEATGTSGLPRRSDGAQDGDASNAEAPSTDTVVPHAPDENGANLTERAARTTSSPSRENGGDDAGGRSGHDGGSKSGSAPASSSSTRGRAAGFTTGDDAGRARTAAGGVSDGSVREGRTIVNRHGATAAAATDGRISAGSGPAFPYDEIPPDLREYVRRYLTGGNGPTR